MVIELNFKSGKPVYLQIVDQVKSAVASGVLVPGDPCHLFGRSPRSFGSIGTPY
jgi:hypothetical protein